MPTHDDSKFDDYSLNSVGDIGSLTDELSRGRLVQLIERLDGSGAANLPRPEYPRPQFARELGWMNLNGDWEFEIDQERSGIERGLVRSEHLSNRITVPFCPESSLSGIANTGFMKAVWYKKRVVLPKAWSKRRVLLHIGACDYRTTVYIDGMEVGNHIGGYTPFSFDISHCLNDGPAEISITIYAEDDIQSLGQSKGKQSHILASAGCDYTRTTGIWQTVWLEAVHRTYLASVRITPQLSANGALVEARVNGDSIDGGRVRFRAYAQEAVAGEALLPVSGKAAGAFLPISQVRAWSPEDPFLYDLEITLESVDGEVLDAVHSYFGLRNVEISGSAILINGKAVFQRLILDQGYYPTGIYTAPTDSDLRNDIELSLSMGFNGARLHQKVFDPRYLYWCDRLGYLVWGESPDWGLDVTQTEHLAGFLQTWVEALERDYNHPSIIGWCPFNEHDFTKTPETVRSIYRLTKALDTSRPVIDSSGWTHVETDILDVHDYEQDPVAFDTRHRQLGIASVDEHPSNDESDRRAGLFAQLPYMVSEFGGIWWNPGQASDEGGWGYGAGPASPAEFLARYRGLVESLLNNPKIFAFCYTQLTDVEQEVNGLCTYDRKPKFDSSEIRAITAQVAAIERLFADR